MPWRFFHLCMCPFRSNPNLCTPHSSIFWWGFACVSQSNPVLSFTPKKQKYFVFILLLLSPTPPRPSLPPPPPSFDPPLQPRWKDDRARKERVEREGKGRERCDSSSTSVAHWGKRERGREREKKRECYSDDELLAMGGGRDICGIKRCWSLVKHALTCRSCFAHTHSHTVLTDSV